MSQQIFVSNRLSVRVDRTEDGFSFVPSVGGLATGLSSVAGGGKDGRSTIWVGWSGIAADSWSAQERSEVARELRDTYWSEPVDLTQEQLDLFYSGFCNDTIWPLFHYFPTYVEYRDETWEAYESVNRVFFEAVRRVAEPDATIWIHDYQLMLLPRLVKEAFPLARVGFFLHIPFPSFELFRLLPSRVRILEGILGADLIGFHTYDYARHFLSSVRRLLGYDHSMGIVQTSDRAVKTDVFPMGIDWARFAAAHDDEGVQECIAQVGARYDSGTVVLSVDRLDYSKGIPNRLRAFRKLLESHPELRGRVVLIMVVSPSRESVPRYMELKSEVDQLVSTINGVFSTLSWTPIQYRYQTVGFQELCALYHRADVLLVTPVRDGMNLIAKEYIAVRGERPGVLVLSETAGAARELSEAIIVNPHDISDITQSLYEAIVMPEEERATNMALMRSRVARHTVQFWASSFLEKLEAMPEIQSSYRASALGQSDREQLVKHWSTARRVLAILDYDGTLRRFFRRPEQARPDDEIYRLLEGLIRQRGVSVVLSSGRDRENLQEWFGHLKLGLGAGHGAWLREANGEWEAAPTLTPEWKESIRPVIEASVDRTPGSHLEEKEFSLAWHYRDSEPELAGIRLAELRETLIGMTENLELSVLEGNRVIEVKPANVNKGRVSQHFAASEGWDLIIAIGDDVTDEMMFQSLPASAWTIKVGVGNTIARYSLDSVQAVRGLLGELLAARS
jgi:trehalose 6-phosphate synthase/phosphatase